MQGYSRRYPPPLEVRFFAKVEKTETCWLWTGALNNMGYGQFRTGKKQMLAHRWAYERFVGALVEGLELDHVCGVTKCVRPDHLEQVTHQVNVLRGKADLVRSERSKVVTHCVHGHERIPKNTYTHKNGRQDCRPCRREASARWYHKKVS